MYSENIAHFQKELARIKKKINLYALLRLVGFVSFLTSLYLYLSRHEPVFLAYSIGFLLVFGWLINISLDLKDKQLLSGQLLFINKNEMDLSENRPNHFDNGHVYLNSDSYLADLDIFGENSLFHLLNRTTTSHGLTQLAWILKNPFSEREKISAYQDAVKILATQTPRRQLLIAYGLLGKEEKGNMHSITEWLKTPNRLNNLVWLKLVRIALPVFNLGALWYSFDSARLLPLLGGIAVSSLLTFFYIAYSNSQHALISKKKEILDQYGAIIKVFCSMDTGASEKLKHLRETLKEADTALHSLSRLSNFFDQRANLLVASFFNMLFLYDIQCVLSLENWKDRHKQDFEGWISAVGDIECLNSLSTFSFNNPDYCYPSVGEGKLQIKAIQISHPLIPGNERVPNDFLIGTDDSLQLVTGSNMSGKTTFLRTVGVNLLLAQCGAPVCATSFLFTPMAILSSIRINDSLQEHTSYFMAELKKLQDIIRSLDLGKSALVLVDEILRGTNSEDKTYGSQQFIRKLLQYPCLALFATHDLTLSALENEYPGAIANYCFESVIKDNELFFDYKLQKGIAKNRNASFLMKKMEII